MLLGIHGRKNSGKDTVATLISIIASEKGMYCSIYHYATTLKLAATDLFGVGIEPFYDQTLKETPIEHLGMTPRQIMTTLHDVLVPAFGEDLFVAPVRRKYQQWQEECGKGFFVVADVRYEGRETDWIRNAGGKIIHVIRSGVSDIPATHSSEQGIPPREGDIILHNDGTIQDLEDEVREKIFKPLFDNPTN